MASTRPFESLQKPPLRRDPHEDLVAVLQVDGSGVVGQTEEGLVVVEHRDLALKALNVVMFKETIGQYGVWLGLGGRIETATMELLRGCSGEASALASAEHHARTVLTGDVDDAEVGAGRSRVRARRHVRMSKLYDQSEVNE